jgi:glycosyltransferase involved in cell wall biosynthesis
MNNFSKDKELVKVLMVAQYFPPAGGVGTFRVTKFVKYLRQFGWEPIVLTVNEDYYLRGWFVDHSLVNDIPVGTRIHRTRLWDLSFINDPGIRWIPFLLLEAARIIRKERPTVLYITADPFFPLIIAPIVRKILGINYVVDLRDPWKLAFRSDRVNGKGGVKARIGLLLSHLLEPLVIRNAHKVICVSNGMCNEYRDEYREIPRDRFAVITNGYDEDDFTSIVPVTHNQFTIVYTGKFLALNVFRDPSNFFKSLRILKERHLGINFIHVGKIEDDILQKATEAGVRDMVKCIGQVSYSESIAYAKGADLLLLIGGGQKSEQTAKIFDYLGCKRPILALARRDGGIAEVVQDVPSARIVENDDPELIAATILEFYENCEHTARMGDLPKYSRRRLTRMLSDVFSEILDLKFNKNELQEKEHIVSIPHRP